jgi:hypothetical protein
MRVDEAERNDRAEGFDDRRATRYLHEPNHLLADRFQRLSAPYTRRSNRFNYFILTPIVISIVWEGKQVSSKGPYKQYPNKNRINNQIQRSIRAHKARNSK